MRVWYKVLWKESGKRRGSGGRQRKVKSEIRGGRGSEERRDITASGTFKLTFAGYRTAVGLENSTVSMDGK